RKVISIDEETCDGCGLCVPACVEGALQIVDGKARLVNERYCDGLGACLGECPQDAITIEEREAEELDEEEALRPPEEEEHGTGMLPCGCPSATVAQFERHDAAGVAPAEAAHQPSTLRHWPVQLTLVPPAAPFLQGADVLLAADCIPFAYADFHRDFLKDHALLVACPKLDDFSAHLSKLADVLRRSRVKSLTVAHMEVPCCFGLAHMAQQAIRLSGKDIPLKVVVVGVKGDLKD
ncbi:MAG: 4Fe-4S binding protein, partial [Chloroflexota bacterium]|nr:4Fe-4S binding protein [Chloroflexota bacterium]